MGFSIFLFSLMGGIAADRLPKRNLLASGQLGIGVFALWIGTMVTMDVVAVWHIVVSSIAVGIIAGFTMPARQSYVPHLVGDENLMNALALNSGIMNMTRIGGPALAGILIAAVGVGPIYYLKFVGYGIFALTLFMIPIPGKAIARAATSLLGDALNGLRYVRHDRTVRELILISLIPVILAMPYINFLPVFQKDVFQVDASMLGLMGSAVGAGAVVGALAVASLGDYRYKGRVLVGSGLGFGVSLTLFGAVAGPNTFALSLALLALAGATGTAYMSLNQALILVITPPEMRGRVTGLFMTTFGLQPLGALPIGALADAFGAPVTIMSFGALTLLFFLGVALLRPNLRRV
jgi:MFS family permease